MLIGLSACAHLKRETIPHGPAGEFATVQPGPYRVKLALDTPRTQAIAWSIECADGQAAHGTIGVAFDQYREGRLEQLNRPRKAALAAAAHPQTRTLTVVTPLGPVAVRSTEEPPPVPPEITELAASDVGTTHYETIGTIFAAGPAQCRVTAAGDEGPVRVAFVVTHTRDLDAEARAARAAAAQQAIAYRAQVVTGLVAAGADVEARARVQAAAMAAVQLREADAARVRAEREAVAARVRAEREAVVARERAARIAIDVRIRGDAYALREEYVAYFVGHCHGDAQRRARIEAAAQEQQRVHFEAERVRFAAAVQFRSSVTDYLLASGARLRPPRPALIAEVSGVAPFPGAVWTAGRWAWHDDAWSWGWVAGGWSDPTRFGETGGDAAVVAAPAPVVEVAPVPVLVGPGPVLVGPTPVIVLEPAHGHVIRTREHHVAPSRPAPKKR
ncbi:MAG TPA: hypothetical protein VGM88_28915 [Kofleriaceae bacterium]